VWNRQLYLFWPIFTEKTHPPTDEEKKNGADPRKYWQIQVAWSEFKNEKWLAKKVSTQDIKYPDYPASPVLPAKSSLRFRTHLWENKDLSILLYKPLALAAEFR